MSVSRPTNTSSRREAGSIVEGHWTAAAVDDHEDRQPPRVAVIGAGIAGLACARSLHRRECPVEVFDRGRGPSGRLSTRRVESPDRSTVRFDHGAPFMTVADDRFDAHVRRWIEVGVCAPWRARVGRCKGGTIGPCGEDTPPIVVGVPGMSAVCRHLADSLELHHCVTVTGLVPRGDAWYVETERDSGDRALAGPYDAVVIAAPPPQVAHLVRAHVPLIADLVAAVHFRPQWVAMLDVDDPLGDLPDIIRVIDQEPIELLVRDDAKPGRDSTSGRSRWVVHASSDWSEARYVVSSRQAAEELLGEALPILQPSAGRSWGQGTDRMRIVTAHRWGLARVRTALSARCVCDRATRIVLCGDGFGGSGVEASFLSGLEAADQVMNVQRARRRT